jgi:hypothetical protein
MLKLFTDTRKTTHTFHVVNEFVIKYDGILDQNFLKINKALYIIATDNFRWEMQS